MKPLAIASLLAATALASAGIAQTGKPAKVAVGPSRSQSASRAADRPQLGTFGFDEAGMDRGVQPGDDYYLYANGTWAKNTPIPADKAGFGAFDQLADLSRERTRGILEADPSSKIGIAYATYRDTAAIDAKGLAPIQPWLAKVKALSDKAGYAALIAEADRHGVDVPFGSGVTQDAKNPDVYTVSLRQGGLGLPDRDYYLGTDAKLVAARTAYQAHLAKMLSLAGEANAEARAKAIVDLETQIAQVHWTRAESRDADKTYNRTALADLQRTAPGFNFGAYFKDVGLPVDAVIVGQPSAVVGEAKVIGAAPLAALKDQLLVRSLEEFADVLPRAIDREEFAFYGTVLSGTPEQPDRWKRAVDWTSGALTDDVSKLYVAKYFPPEAKAAADALVRNLIDAMNARIERLTWMAPETKAKAHAKLAAFTPRIGYPTKWREYSSLTISAGDAFGNKLRTNQWKHAYNAGKLGKPIYRWEWGLAPMTVNAQANPTLVAITFPAAILQPPFFDPKADPAVNYGGIGAVIGHEMSHHFDDQGSKFDATGRLTQWWTNQDVARFKALSKQLADQYSSYEPLPGFHVNGELTLGENSADLAGLNAAYDAYQHSLGGRKAPVIDGFNGEQRFFLGWAQVWRGNYREQARVQRLLTDPHAPGQQRVWTVRNLDSWYAAVKPAAGSKLYLAPDQRVRIW